MGKARKPKNERPAGLLDTIGRASRYLFARHETAGHRITASRFYRLEGDNDYRRGGYVLMTTKAPFRAGRSDAPTPESPEALP